MGIGPVPSRDDVSGQKTAGSQPQAQDQQWKEIAGSKTGAAVSSASQLNDYADLFNGFQELAAAAVNPDGKGLETYPLGRDLSAKHRDLLNDVRKVLIAGRSASPEARQSAAADWRRISKKLRESLDEARKLRIRGDVIAAVNDDIALIGERYLRILPVNGKSEAESSDDYAETLFAIRGLLYEFNRMGEGSLGALREGVEGRPDAVVGMATRGLNAEQREKLEAVKLGEHMLERHRALVEKLRETMLLARSEKPGSAYKALSQWNAIKSELAHVMARAPAYTSDNLDDASARGVTYVNANMGDLERGLNGFGGVLAKHYELVHTETLAAALKAPPRPGEAETDRLAQAMLSKEAQAKLQEPRMLGHFRYMLNVVEHGITRAPGRPGEWLLTSGPVQIRLRDDEVAHLRAVAAGQLSDYMQYLVTKMVGAAENYDSIRRGTASWKLSVLGTLGGAADPGSQDYFRGEVFRVRDKEVQGMLENGEFLKAFDTILAEKEIVERQAKKVADWDGDLDKGYNRLARGMQVLEVAITMLVPEAGAAALAEGYGIAAVGGTALASGTVAPMLAEGIREAASGDGLQPAVLARTARHGFAVSTGAIAGPVTEELGGFLAASKVPGVIEKTLAAGTVGGTQSLMDGGSFGEGFVASGVTHLTMQGFVAAGVNSRVSSAAGGAFGNYVVGNDWLPAAAGGLVSPPPGSRMTRRPVSGAGGEAGPLHVDPKADATGHGRALSDGIPEYVGPAGDAVYRGPAPSDGVPEYLQPAGDQIYAGPVPSDGVPVYAGPGADAAYHGPAPKRLGAGSPPSTARPPLSEAEWEATRKQRSRARPFNLRPDGPPAGGQGGPPAGGGREQALRKLGITGEKRTGFERGEKVWVTRTEGGRSVNIFYQFKGGKLTIGAIEARDLSKLLNQSTDLARELQPDTIRLEVTALPGTLGNNEQQIVQSLRDMGFEQDPKVPGLMARETRSAPNTPEFETRAMADSESPRRQFYDSEAKLREGVSKALQTAIEKAKVKAAMYSEEWQKAQVQREEFFTELGKIDPQLAVKARRYDAAINDPRFLEEQMVYLWNEAAAHGRTMAGELEYILGRGNVNEFDPPRGQYQVFEDALRDPRPVVDIKFAPDIHGSHTHMFHEFLGDRLFGPGGGRDFRLRLATLGWDRWTYFWDVLFDAPQKFQSLNSPEVLGEILQTHLDFPKWVPPQP
jgi:hypothetical protein